MTTDLKELEKVLNKFSLRLIQTKGLVYIDGLERDKRICLMENDYSYFQMIPSNLISPNESAQFEFIRQILMEELLDKRYPISDVEFQNIIIWINISIKRISNFFYLNEEDINDGQNYDIEIEKITTGKEQEPRSMTIKITDPDLLGKTGGIIQGMSGSPIIQNGMLVGAVTHVFLNDPTMGYGVFAETMVSEEERIFSLVS